jgi:hypothetical protein
MATVEIPLLRESAAFATRLIQATSQFGESRYRIHRRINWTHRYDTRFYASENECFRSAPEAYMAGRAVPPDAVQDVYAMRLPPRALAVQLAKVAAHGLFRLLGRLAGPARCATYRKAYVDDIELVFDPAEADVLRMVYPFPLNVRRQLHYVASLRSAGRPWRFAGHAYAVRDLFRLLVQRDVGALMRLESRAQIRHAHELLRRGFRRVQLSDEFDIGSLDFCRRLRHAGIEVVNSAHGVGKYLPVHAYAEFHVLTDKQARYYTAARPCRYSRRRLNDRGDAAVLAPSDGIVRLVFLSQVFPGVGEIVASNEARALLHLRDSLGHDARVRLLYRAHPNRSNPPTPEGFEALHDLATVNGRAGTVFVSQFSTCQIDPLFKGRKVLLRGELVYPEIAFDDSETVVDLDGLVALVIDATGPSARPTGLRPEEAHR